jgi:hypothetical protein
MGEEDFKQGIRSTGSRNVKVPSSATSVADPDPNPDPSDLYVFGPPGSGSISQIEVWIRILLSPSKNCKRNLDSYCFVASFWLFISLKNDVNVPLKSNKQKNFTNFLGIL